MGRGGGSAHPAGRRALVRRQRRGVRRAGAACWSTRGRSSGCRDAKRPNSYLALSDPVRRRAGRGPDVHLLRARGRRRPDEQLGRPGRDARDARRALRGQHARPHDVRRAVLDGPAGLADLRDRRPAHRLRLRRLQHADHDPHGRRRARAAGRGRHLGAVPAHGRRAARGRRGGRAVAVQRREVHRPLPRDARDLVLRLGLRRQRAAGQEVLRAADRERHGPRRGLAGRAHADPQADLAARASPSTSPAPSRPPAARPTWRC